MAQQDPNTLISMLHLEKMVEYLEKYPVLALTNSQPHVRGNLERLHFMWEKIAVKLNRVDAVVKKTGQSWAKFWILWRCSIRRRYINLQRCRSLGIKTSHDFNKLELRLLRVLTDDTGYLIPTMSEYMHSKYLRRFRWYCNMNNNNNNNNNTTTINNNQLLPIKPMINSQAINLPPRNPPATIPHATSPPATNLPLTYSPATNIQATNPSATILLANNSSATYPLATNPPITNPPETNSAAINPSNGQYRLVQMNNPSLTLDKSSIEALRRELVEFELKKQKEMLKIELKQREEKHGIDISILELKKKLLERELRKT